MIKKEHILTIVALILVWWGAAILIGRSFILPTPLATIQYLIEILGSPETYKAIFTSMLRVFIGFMISLLCAFIVCVLCNQSDTIKKLFEPIFVLTKSIPNISYMIIALIWLGSEGAVTLVSFMILFPVFLNGFMNALESEDEILKDVEKVYPESFFAKMKNKLFPQLLPEMIQTGKTAASLGFKVGIMAEILGSVNVGIGRQISYCKTELNMAGIFAWTLMIIVICLLLDLVFDQIYQYRFKEENGWKS